MASSSTSQLPLFYSCIAHNTTILSEHTASASSQTSSLPSLILPKIQHSEPQKLTYTHGSHFIHYVANAPSEYDASAASAGGLTFLVVSASSFGRRIPFTYLSAIKDAFLAQYPPGTTDFGELPSYGCAAFNGRLREMMTRFGSAGGEGDEDALGRARHEIEDVRGIMTQNIERVLERGERIDSLVDKTDRLGMGAHDFRMRSRGLRRQMWWKNVKLMVLLGVVAVFICFLIYFMVR